MNILGKENITFNIVPDADIEAGTPVIVGGIVGFANYKILKGELGAVDLNGIYKLEKIPTGSGAYEAIAAGSKIKTTAEGKAVGEGGEGVFFGFSVEPSTESDAYVSVKLFPELNALLKS